VFILGHSVVGPRLVRLVRPRLLLLWLVLGGLLPDLIDKPLYWGLVAFTGKHGAELGLISGTRTFGHTAIFLSVFIAIAWVFRRRPLGAVFVALAWGIASHHLLDNFGDLPGTLFGPDVGGPSTLDGWLFPLRGPHFPVSPFKNLGEQLLSASRLYVLFGEFLGAALLIDAWRTRRMTSQK
jgi:hypothetical protein